ncbi:hypothetical protein Daus18300_013299 [Diaporthe australafricana]|uniref:F-box domain-containing protein n=1 Tax=Diaporthe australafricana TaxID=127596 RepID=A0ABR3VZW2_9PEZI
MDRVRALRKKGASRPRANTRVVATKKSRHQEPDSTDPSSTNLLLSLPPELLIPIFSYVGIGNFRQDVRRLAVSKEWYAFTRPILLGNLRLHTTDLRPMLRAMRGAKKLAAAQQLAKHIDLTIDSPPPNPQLGDKTSQTIYALEELSSKLKGFDVLRTLAIRSRLADDCAMSNQVFSGFVDHRHLTSLEIDLVDIRFERTPVHLCDYISQLIPNLKRLGCRLSRICSELLATPPKDLEELVINLGASREEGDLPRHCFGKLSRSPDELRKGLVTRLVEYAATMHNPKMVRLIVGWPDYNRPFAYDAIEQQWLLLELDSAWDADGEVVPDEWMDSSDEEDDDDDDDTDTVVPDGNEGTEVEDGDEDTEGSEDNEDTEVHEE